MSYGKRALIGVVVIGVLGAVLVGTGAFGSFSATTTNPNNTFATGTLILTNTANSGTACLSTAGTNNNNPGCDAVIPSGAGNYVVGKVAVGNGGTLDGSSLLLSASNCTDTGGVAFNTTLGNPLCGALITYVEETDSSGAAVYCWFGKGAGTTSCTNWSTGAYTTLSGPLSTAAPITSLPVGALPTAIPSGDSVTVTSGTHSQSFTVASNAAIGDTSITINSATPLYAFPSGSSVADINGLGDTGGTYAASLSSALSTSGAITSLPVTRVATTLASGDTVEVYWGAQSQTFVVNNPAAPGDTSISINSATPTFAFPAGSAVADRSDTTDHPAVSLVLASSLSTGGAITSLSVNGVSSDIPKGAQITVYSGTHSQTFTTSSAKTATAVSPTSIAITSVTPNFAYPTSSTVVSSSNEPTLTNLGATSSVQIDLPRIASGDVVTGPALAVGVSRNFQIGLYLDPARANNSVQGLTSTFALTWQMLQ